MGNGNRFEKVYRLLQLYGHLQTGTLSASRHVLDQVVVSETGEYPQVTNHIYPVLCDHCTEAVCVKVCPSGATTRRSDGLVDLDHDKCVGCRYCVIACPYQQRTFYSDGKKEYFPGQGLTELEIIGKELYPLRPVQS